MNLVLLNGCVFLLHNAQNFARAVTDDPPITLRIINYARGQSHCRVLGAMRFQNSRQCLGTNQRSIAGEHKYFTDKIMKCRAAHLHGMARTLLLGLMHPDNIALIRKFPHNRFPVMAHHHNDPLYAGLPRSIQHIRQHGSPAYFMQDLDPLTFHTRRFTGSEDNSG